MRKCFETEPIGSIITPSEMLRDFFAAIRSEETMSQAFVFCPQSESWIYTGLNVEWLGLDTLQLGQQQIACPKCGQEHEWTTEELILRSDGAG